LWCQRLEIEMRVKIIKTSNYGNKNKIRTGEEKGKEARYYSVNEFIYNESKE